MRNLGFYCIRYIKSYFSRKCSLHLFDHILCTLYHFILCRFLFYKNMYYSWDIHQIPLNHHILSIYSILNTRYIPSVSIVYINEFPHPLNIHNYIDKYHFMERALNSYLNYIWDNDSPLYTIYKAHTNHKADKHHYDFRNIPSYINIVLSHLLFYARLHT